MKSVALLGEASDESEKAFDSKKEFTKDVDRFSSHSFFISPSGRYLGF